MDFEISELIQYENLPGIHVEEETQRYYPRGTLAAHAGLAGIDNQGYGRGVYADDYLTGEDGSIVGQYDAWARLPQAEYQYVPPKDGYDVYLTIERIYSISASATWRR